MVLLFFALSFQIAEMKFGWAAALGNIKSAEDAEMLFKQAMGIDSNETCGEYGEWGQLRVKV